ncbi:YagK/YfjJ domain-containing protein [Halomonas litopenaei]|uniref:YagK/YfjJ domain-containing protein n=1 Tax=Halomonas litopenaei TaxID=2109328 RepID=UPI003FA093FF
MFQHHPLRHPLNDKLRLHYEDTYRGFDVQHWKDGPLVTNYLERVLKTLNAVTWINHSTFAFRVDLHFPSEMPRLPMHETNDVLARFFDNFRNEIIQRQTKYPTQLHNLWAREQVNSDKPHYHLMIMLNKNAYDSLGAFAPDWFGVYSFNNLYHRMMRSWLKAMGFDHDDPRFRQLIHVCEDPVTEKPWSCVLHRHDRIAMNEAVYMASYLCKAYSKPFGQRAHVFDGSRFPRQSSLITE